MILLAVSAPAALFSQSAFAAGACEKFDSFLTGNIECHVEVKGGCEVDCSSLKFEAGCSGGCTATGTTMCTDTCGTKCVAECDPAALDCYAGCHAECDAPATAECKTKEPGADCVAEGKAHCDMHCDSACQVPDTNCSEHCTACCTGTCDTQINYDCDFNCFADLSGGCTADCEAPSGALFCNGQYIGVDDVEGCITELAAKGINVDVSARGEVKCDLTGCNGNGSGSAGFCSYSPGTADVALGGAGALLLGMAGALTLRRRRNKK